MKIEKKLILCSILAISIGIASIMPLALFMSTTKAQTTDDVPWFNVDIPYAYYEATTENETRTFPEGPVAVVNYRTNSFIRLNYTVNPAAEGSLENARVEYFQLQIYSDLGQIANETTYFGANCEDDFDYMKSFMFSRENWFNSSEISAGGGTFLSKFNGTLAGSLADGWPGGMGHGHGSSCFANPTLPQEFLNAQNAQTIFIDVRRIGSFVFVTNSTTVKLADNSVVIAHIELIRDGDRFVYGVVPQEWSAPEFTEPKP